MRNGFLRLVMGVCFAVLTFAALLPNGVEAVSLRIDNSYPHEMTVAVVYFDDAAGKWRTRGWYIVKPETVKTVHFNDSTKANRMWIHAYTSEAKWGADGDNVIERIVTRKAFSYTEGQPAPQGEGRRQESFSRYYADNDGVVRFGPK